MAVTEKVMRVKDSVLLSGGSLLGTYGSEKPTHPVTCLQFTKIQIKSLWLNALWTKDQIAIKIHNTVYKIEF